LQHHPALDAVLLFDRPRGAAAFVDFLRRVRAERPDLTLDLQRHLKSGIVSWVSGAGVRWASIAATAARATGSSTPIRSLPCRASARSCGSSSALRSGLGWTTFRSRFGLRLTEAEERRVDDLLGGLADPVCRRLRRGQWESKRWFIDRTAAVADALAARGVGVVLVGGKPDAAFAVAVTERAHAPVRDLTGKITLRDLIGIFRRSRAAFGPDPAHAYRRGGRHAGRLSVGATKPGAIGPCVTRKGDCRRAPCSPCYVRRCPIGRLCMESIGVEAVVAKLVATLG